MPILVCHVGDCDRPVQLSWQRAATEAELAELPALREKEGRAAVLVLGCIEHKIDDQSAAGLHAADCQAPPACTCTPTYPPADPVPWTS
ncbi:hypothetical protein [Crossiella sp. CA198]|uniref:hypothetical protein n=1 Tax=Crossiella sp. CA198 TaxID=3455607 RepID=UPI003F8D368E